MNDYRNFQRKTRRRKGSNFNKHCKGKQGLKQKNNYNIVFSNKYTQIDQSKHSQRCDKFVQTSKKVKDIRNNLFHCGITGPEQRLRRLRVLKHQVEQKINEKHILDKALPFQDEYEKDIVGYIFDPVKNCASIVCSAPLNDPKASKKTMILYCLDKTFYFSDIYNYNSANNVKENKKQNTHNNIKSTNINDNENFFTRMPCDVFLHCICNKYLYPNEIFLLLSLSKNIYTILTDINDNNSNSFLHSLISNQRIIDYLLKLIDLLNDIANNGPQLFPISETYQTGKDHLIQIMNFNFYEQQQRISKIGSVKQFRTRIHKLQSICASIISWVDDKSREKLLINYYAKENVNPNVDTSFVGYDFNVTDKEFKKIEDLNESLNKIVKRLQYLFIVAVSTLQLNDNNNNNNKNDKNVKIFCDDQLVDAFCKNIGTVKVMNHLNKRCRNINVKSRMTLKSTVEFIQMSDCMRLYFDDKNTISANELDQYNGIYNSKSNCNTCIVGKNDILCIYTWSEYKRFLKKWRKYPEEPTEFTRFLHDYEQRCAEYRVFEWISCLTTSNISNALLLVVCCLCQK